MAVAFLDVHYRGEGARAACVLAESWQETIPRSSYVEDIPRVEPYEPGSFYRRELPCLLAVLRRLPELPEAIVIDGYVWLPGDRPGLGAHLYAALGARTAVVGIAKSPYAGVEGDANIAQVLRGASTRPLFITAAGMDLARAAERVRNLAGKHRISELVRAADQLARGLAGSA